MPVEHYPLGLQTTYRDLLDRHSRRPVPEVPGSIILTTNSGNRYWVVKQRIGTKVLEHRIGPDTHEVRQRAERLKAENDAAARWNGDAAGLVAQLRAARMPVPTAGTGKLINALAKASFFRSGGVLAGTHAFGLYALELGIRLENALAQTEDVDIAADRNVRVIAGAGASLTSSLDGIGLSPVGGPMDSRPVRWETSDGVVLDILTPRRRTADPIVRLAGLGVWAQALPLLEFGLKDPIEAVALYREGLAVRIPSPERLCRSQADRCINENRNPSREIRQGSDAGICADRSAGGGAAVRAGRSVSGGARDGSEMACCHRGVAEKTARIEKRPGSRGRVEGIVARIRVRVRRRRCSRFAALIFARKRFLSV